MALHHTFLTSLEITDSRRYLTQSVLERCTFQSPSSKRMNFGWVLMHFTLGNAGIIIPFKRSETISSVVVLVVHPLAVSM